MDGKAEENIVCIRIVNPAFPGALAAGLGKRAPERIFVLGNLDILERKPVALFCSMKCPGNLILKTYDLARELRDKGVTVISGFHSPMEKEYFSLLLRGKQPVIWCPAKRLPGRGLSKECRDALTEGRLLVISPFGEKVKRATKETAFFRNEFVAALAERVFVAHAAPGSKTEAFCRQALHRRKPLLTFDAPENAALLELGARTFDVENVTVAFGTEFKKKKEGVSCST
jgi:predicted Rossmann fold nucleotide-binding protein DprA/Smf involved in DNA uptake